MMIRYKLAKKLAVCCGVAMLATTALQAEARPPHGGGGPWGEVFKDISPEGRKIVHDALEAGKPDFEAKMKERDVREREIAKTIGAAELDTDKLQELLDSQQDDMKEGMEKMHTRMVDTISKLSPADRKIVAETIERRITKRQERKAKYAEKMKSLKEKKMDKKESEKPVEGATPKVPVPEAE